MQDTRHGLLSASFLFLLLLLCFCCVEHKAKPLPAFSIFGCVYTSAQFEWIKPKCLCGLFMIGENQIFTSMAFSAFDSWMTPTAALAIRISRITMGSTKAVPESSSSSMARTNETAAATRRMMTSWSLNCSRIISQRGVGSSSGSSVFVVFLFGIVVVVPHEQAKKSGSAVQIVHPEWLHVKARMQYRTWRTSKKNKVMTPSDCWKHKCRSYPVPMFGRWIVFVE